MSLNQKKVKIVWLLKVTDDGKFYTVDHHGNVIWATTWEQSRHKMVEYAFDHGADEVKHDYDLVKYGT